VSRRKEMLNSSKSKVLVVLLAVGAAVFGTLALTACDDDDTGDNNGPKDTGPDPEAACPGDLDESIEPPLCTIQDGEYTDDATWIADVTYLLSGRVYIGDGESKTTLTIEPGTQILGDATLDEGSALIIQRNAMITAEGTPEEPIVFSSSKEIGKRAPGDWGGVVINGNAPINICEEADCESVGEGDTGKYGGTKKADNSGTLKYVRIEFSGKQLDPEKEFNGLTLQGVGSGTTIDYIQIHRVADDNIEFFGGTAEVKHLLLTGCGDDGFDWTQGWSGKAQYVIIQQVEDIETNNGIEADSWGDNNDAAPRANPTLYNFTIIGAPKNKGKTFGVLLREGTAGKLRNFIITDFKGCLDIDQSATWQQVDDGKLTIDYSMVDADDCFKVETDDPDTTDVDESDEGGFMVKEDFWEAGSHNMYGDPELDGWVPKSGSPVLGAGDDAMGADFIGAVGEEDWTEGGWTDFPEN
jgi:hypothetical protein